MPPRIVLPEIRKVQRAIIRSGIKNLNFLSETPNQENKNQRNFYKKLNIIKCEEKEIKATTYNSHRVRKIHLTQRLSKNFPQHCLHEALL